MGMKTLRAIARVGALLTSVAVLVGACGSDTAEERAKAAQLAEGCLIDSDCQDPLVCAFKRCHVQCIVQRDCQREELCVPAGENKVCLLESERFCEATENCPGEGLVCKDQACRPACTNETDCVTGQVCVDGACGTCIYNSECKDPLVCKGGLCLAECKVDRDCRPFATTCNAQGVCVGSGTPDGGAGDGSPGEGGTDASVVVPKCSNGVLDPGESGVDCGGSCGACKGAPCTKPNECASGICTGQQCAEPTCSDGQQNGDESDEDCGGSCPPCASTKGCWTTKDCDTGSCTAGSCTAPQCQDKLLNGTETDVDCGGAQCPACALGNACVDNGDCSSGNCVAKKCVKAGPTSWVRTAEQSNRQVRVATDSQGNAAVLWQFNSSQDFGKGPLIVVGGGLALTKYTPAGALVGNPLALDSPGSDTPKTVAMDGAGDIFVLAQSAGPANFGGVSSVNCGGITSANMVIAKYRGSDLGHIWSRCVNGPGAQVIPGVGAVDSQGNLIVTGRYTGSVDFNRDFGGSVQSGTQHIFVAKYSGVDGKLLEHAQYFGHPSYPPAVNGIATAGTDVFLTGAFSFETKIGNDTLTHSGGTDMFVIKLKSDLLPVKSIRHGGAAGDSGHAIAVMGTQSIIVAGDFQGQVNFGNGNFEQAVDNRDIALLRLKQSDLSTEWTKSFGSTGIDVPKAVAVASNTEIALVGATPYAVNFGGGTLPHASNTNLDGFWARLKATDGSWVDAEAFGTLGNDEAHSAAYAGTNLLIGGHIAKDGIITIGNQSLPNKASSFAAMIEP